MFPPHFLLVHPVASSLPLAKLSQLGKQSIARAKCFVVQQSLEVSPLMLVASELSKHASRQEVLSMQVLQLLEAWQLPQA
jgi:hypothetical protein